MAEKGLATVVSGRCLTRETGERRANDGRTASRTSAYVHLASVEGAGWKIREGAGSFVLGPCRCRRTVEKQDYGPSDNGPILPRGCTPRTPRKRGIGRAMGQAPNPGAQTPRVFALLAHPHRCLTREGPTLVG